MGGRVRRHTPSIFKQLRLGSSRGLIGRFVGRGYEWSVTWMRRAHCSIVAWHFQCVCESRWGECEYGGRGDNAGVHMCRGSICLGCAGGHACRAPHARRRRCRCGRQGHSGLRQVHLGRRFRVSVHVHGWVGVHVHGCVGRAHGGGFQVWLACWCARSNGGKVDDFRRDRSIIGHWGVQ